MEEGVRRGVMVGVVTLLVASACSFGTGVAGRPDLPDDGVSSIRDGAFSVARFEAPPRQCLGQMDSVWIEYVEPVVAAVRVSEATFACAEVVTVAPLGDEAAVAAGEAHASDIGGPLLLVDEMPDSGVVAEVARLDPRFVAAVGLPDLGAGDVGRYPVRHLTGVAAAGDRDPFAGPPGRGVWVVESGAGGVTPAVRAAARAADAEVMVVGVDDLRALEGDSRERLRDTSPGPVGVVGLTSDALWQAEVVRRGLELPGGGQLMFPDRRLVALYGHPGSPGLGVLGEQGAGEAVERVRRVLDGYDADGVAAVGAFEIIATVADSQPGEDGDYSAESTIDHLRPWVDAAADAGTYVILDLQPGRTDFLTQARRYEELLREPHVGLALDPEWRLEPDQFHLQQIGSVDAAEINTVVEWLAALVRDEALPQKLLLVHQFDGTMITNRYKIETPAELAVAVQVDGFGPADVKVGAWGRLTDRVDADRLWWGWKNFYDEDPEMFGPEQVLELSPTVYYVSFQ